MTRFLTLTVALMCATSAQAHPGHLAEVAGHGHWLGAAAIGAAIAIGIWGAAKGRKTVEPKSDTDDAEADPDAAPET